MKVLEFGRDVKLLVLERVICISRERIEAVIGDVVNPLGDLEEKILDLVGDF